MWRYILKDSCSLGHLRATDPNNSINWFRKYLNLTRNTRGFRIQKKGEKNRCSLAYTAVRKPFTTAPHTHTSSHMHSLSLYCAHISGSSQLKECVHQVPMHQCT
uniref:Uncharacterized protein n=1 Tax=Cyprinus carpio TaxID=7962 RepID=A0A8C2HFV4_CYPCA